MDEIKQAYAWQQSLDLAKELVVLCEKFSDVDTNVLVWHLRQAVAEVPASVAADLRANRPATMEPVVRLMTILELVTKIYPGIDTDDAVTHTNQLIERMESDTFGERQPKPEAASTDEDDRPEGDAAQTEGAGGSVPTQQVDGVSGNQSQPHYNEE